MNRRGAVQIAVVDGDRTLLALLEELFADEGWTTLSCLGGTSAFPTLLQAQPDAVLLDPWLETPSVGWHLLQRLQDDSHTRQIPVIVCSAYSWDVQETDTWLTRRNIAVVSKPFNIEDLLCTIREVLRGSAGPTGRSVPAAS